MHLNQNVSWMDLPECVRSAFQTKFTMPTKDILQSETVLHKFNDSSTLHGPGNSNLSPWWSHALFVVAGLALWFWTQNLIGEQHHVPGTVGDAVHLLLAAPNLYLQKHRAAANGLLIVSSALIDALGIFLLVRAIFGPTLRPFLGLLILFGMRQICQLLTTLDPPDGMVWHDPGFPSLLVTYHVATDFFFSGHTGIAILGAVELARIGGRSWLAVGIAIAAFEATTVLVLRAHYTMDVFTGAVAARYATLLASQIAPACDSWLAKLFAGKSV